MTGIINIRLSRPAHHMIFVTCAVLITLLSLAFSGVRAQTRSATDGSTPLALTPGAPAGSYALSGFENVNLYNGNLNFSLPILRIGGRGQTPYTMTLKIERHWRVEHRIITSQGIDCDPAGPCPNSSYDKYSPTTYWWSANPTYDGPQGPGTLQMRYEGLPASSCEGLYRRTLTRLTFTAPDGTEYELRDQLNGGKSISAALINPCNTQDVSRGTVFVTADGTAATFVSDSAIIDQMNVGVGVDYPSGYLMLRDGTHYRINDGTVTWLRDRNGNLTRFSYDLDKRVTQITDSLNRQVTISYATDTSLFDQINYKGFAGAARTMRIWHASLSMVLRADSTLQTDHQLFPELNGGSGSPNFNPTVTSALELPDGRRYQFYYNSYGELARVVLPTGGAIEYDYGAGIAGDNLSGVVQRNSGNTNNQYQVYRRVLERRVYPNGGGTPEGITTFGRPEGSGDPAVVVDQLDSNGTTLRSRMKHYYYGIASDSLYRGPLSYPNWNDGKEYGTETIDTANCTPATCASVLRRVVNTWQQRAPVSWWTRGADTAPPNDPRLSETITTIEPNGPNLVAKQALGYDDTVSYNNQNNVKEYDYGVGAPGPLRRETRTTYQTAANYTDVTPGAHLRNLPTQQSIFDGGGIERARTTYEYDNHVDDSNHSSLIDLSGISGLDSSFATSYTTRGNATATTHYLLNSNGQVTGSISSYALFAVAGNVVKTIDARGYATTLDYGDRFGAPNGDARATTGPTELSAAGQYSYAFVTSSSNALGQIVYSQYDYYTGRPVDAEDANGIVSSGYIDNDPLDRPTKVIRAANQGVPVRSQTTFSYDDVNRVITTTGDQTAYSDNLLKSQTLYDGLGRTTETRTYEGGTNFIAVRQQYDALARVYKVSNPFRPWNGETVAWTTTGFDALSRVISVTTPDNAIVSTAYSGSQILVTDQALKQRLSRANARGQLADVWEITGADTATEAISFPGHAEVTAGYHTTYDYDVLDDLTKVAQGTQPTRNFVYDSLKRLISASNPETGNVNYAYDKNGNLQLKTDARGVSAHYDSDALNRPLRGWYNGSTSLSATTNNSPELPASVGASNELNYFYDSQTLPSGAPIYSRGSSTGRLVAVTYGGGSAGDYFAYDAIGHGTLKIQQTGGVNYQTSASYNLASHLVSENYPSGRTVSFAYDQAGRAISAAGNLGGTSRTYSTGISYSPFGSLKQEQFGTDTPVYNKLYYNSRGQLSEIRESTAPNNTSWNRGAIINHYSDECWGLCSGHSMTDNNGNLKKQDHYIPDNEQVSSSQTYTDSFAYDRLNRLQAVTESRYVSSTNETTTSWAQAYSYDRFGNRTINTQNNATWGSGINAVQALADPNSNRIYAPNDMNHALMDYDAAGNQTKDYLTSNGRRIFDAENRITSATDTSNHTSSYSYDGNGARVQRNISGTETWQVYGISGELLAEYAGSASASSPQKEYGYRNGQLLITAAAPSLPRTNFALASNGAVATASSTYSGYGFSPGAAIDGEHKGLNWLNGGGWHSSTNTFPQWLQVDFNASRTIDEIDVYTVQDNYTNPSEPTESTTFTLYGLTGYEVQYWDGSAWVTVPNGSVTGNNKVWRKITFSSINTSKIRLLTNAGVDGWSRLPEIEAWGNAAPPPRTNVALAANGSVASASSTYLGYTFSPAATIDGEHKGLNWLNGGGWNDATTQYPDWLEMDFSGSKTIDEIDVYTVQDNYANPSEPTETMTFTAYGNTAFTVQYWNGSAWRDVTGGNVTGNNKVWRKFNFSAITTSKIRVLINDSADHVYSRIVEVEAWGTAATAGGTAADIEWLVTDQLGTPRMVFDKTGSLLNTKRHDYLPFGEELTAGVGQRSVQQGYGVNDGIRQQFTQKERDRETGLDYFGARYYASTQGRFTSVDPLLASGRVWQPQSWNRYTYVLNSPVRLVDPNGLAETNPNDPQKKDGQPKEQPQTIRPPDNVLAQALTMITDHITVTLNDDPNRIVGTDGVMELDGNTSSQLTDVLTDAFTRGHHVGSLAGASNGLVIPSEAGKSITIGGSLGISIGKDGGSGTLSGNGSVSRFESAKIMAQEAWESDVRARVANSDSVAQVAGELQNTQVSVTTAQRKEHPISRDSFWRERVGQAVNYIYGQGVNQGFKSVGPAAIKPPPQ